MGYTTRGEITDFWPDDTESKIYILEGTDSLATLIDRAKDKWPNASLDKISIGAEKIHTNCIGYDLYDSSDYTMFLTMELSI